MKRIAHLIGLILMAGAVSCSNGAEEDVFVINGLEDLEGRTVSVLGGSVQDLLASDKISECTFLRSDAETDAYTMVETGKACAAVASSINWAVAENSFHNIVRVGEPMNPIPIGFAFNKGCPALLEEFNAFLKDYLEKTDIDKAVADWMNPESDRKMPDPDEVSGENGTLHFVTSAMVEPFSFIRQGEVVGAEAEILANFAAGRNMKWDFTNVAFSGLITFLQSGKADIGFSIMSITPERQQCVDFSIPWTTESSVLLVGREYAPAELLQSGSGDETSFLDSLKESLHKTLIKEDRYKMLLDGLGATLLISILSAIFGTLLGILLCFCSMRSNRLVSGAANVYVEFMRCMPQVVLLMILFYVVFGNTEITGSWVAIIAFSLCFGAYTSVIFKSCVESIDKGQMEAALSLGFGRVKAFVNVVLPQAVQRAVPLYKGEFIGLVKATSIVGYIAVFDLTKAGDIIRSRTFEAFFPLILVTLLYFIVIYALTLALKYIESKTQPKRKKFFK